MTGFKSKRAAAQDKLEQWNAPSEAFNQWWNGGYDDSTNPFTQYSIAYWDFAGWQAALAQPAQEPFGYLSIGGNPIFQKDKPEIGRWETLYTTPTQLSFYNAIEAKLKEKTMDEDDDTQEYKDDGNALLIAYQSGYYDGKKAAHRDALAILEKALAQPAQEPVATVIQKGGRSELWFKHERFADLQDGVYSLYLHLPQAQRKPLASFTEDEIAKWTPEMLLELYDKHMAYKEKNNEDV